MRPIGQNAPISRHVGRYGLGDRDKSLYGSTTSINRQRLIRVIAMKVSKRPGVRGGNADIGCLLAKGEDKKDAALPRVASISVGANFKSNTEEPKK